MADSFPIRVKVPQRPYPDICGGFLVITPNDDPKQPAVIRGPFDNETEAWDLCDELDNKNGSDNRRTEKEDSRA